MFIWLNIRKRRNKQKNVKRNSFRFEKYLYRVSCLVVHDNGLNISIFSNPIRLHLL